MDVLQKLRQLQQERGWSDYRIAKEAKLSPNTVSNIFRRGTLPSVSTLEALCGAFGITVAQFFVRARRNGGGIAGGAGTAEGMEGADRHTKGRRSASHAVV